MIEPKDKSRHHHGNLHRTLVLAGIEILETEGTAALTLRRCAARAGVSHAAPAHHFGNLEGLRAAISDEGFQRFHDAMASHAAAADPSPRGQLKGIARGYLDFVRRHPAVFDLMFSFRRGSEALDKVREGGSASYAILRRSCAPFVPDGTDPVVIEAQVWALVHGHAHLMLSGHLPEGNPPEEAVLALLDRIGTTPGETPPVPPKHGTA